MSGSTLQTQKLAPLDMEMYVLCKECHGQPPLTQTIKADPGGILLCYIDVKHCARHY
jgi:hypothetical protein